mmetsp:Transcript_24207/g.57261  ORF Transcript_24207/g.57261 Transcript_24207/m.57261 type:complete len:330 (+) Transcript_24207:72-1061(+)
MSSGSVDPKFKLQKSLGKLLGFDDGAEDVMEYLLSIQSAEDVSEYLQQLLGLSSESDELNSFVEDMGRYHRGEKLSHNEAGDGDDHDKADGSSNTKLPAHRQSESQKSSSLSISHNNTNNKNNKSRNQKQQKSRVPPPARKKSPPRSAVPSPSTEPVPSKSPSQSPASTKVTPSENTSAFTSLSSSQTAAAAAAATKTVAKSRPKKGQRKNPGCGCFGTKHEPLTNCLLCGRISCVIESYDYCPFCSYLLEEVKVDESQAKDDKAWIQKERLLRFDREFARRTEIFDDQADYQNPTTWMSEEERQEAEEKQREHLESMKRPKQTLNLDI